MTSGPIKAIEVFYSYAHEDERLRNKLEKQLSLLKRQGFIKEWHDRKISAGKEWADEISTYLNTADIILLLVSPDFLASEYCYSIEVKRALERHERGEAHVIPIILHQVYWRGAPFGKLQALPEDAKPVTGPGWRNQNEALFNVAEGIRRVVEEVLEHLIAETTETVPEIGLQQSDLNTATMLLGETKEAVEITSANLEAGNSLLDTSILTLQRVVDVWDDIRRLTKQKINSGLMAAYLGYFKVVGIEGTAKQPIIVIQAAKRVHYEYVKTNDRYKDLEWALTEEFGLPCKVRLVQPEISYNQL
jgi:TIR domain